MSRREDLPAQRAAWESDGTSQQQPRNCAALNRVARPGLRAAWALRDRGVAAPRTRRRDAPILLHLDPLAGRRTSAAHAQCAVGPGMAESLGPQVQAPPPAWAQQGRAPRLGAGGRRDAAGHPPEPPWPAQAMHGCCWAGRSCRRRPRCWSPLCYWAQHSAWASACG